MKVAMVADQENQTFFYIEVVENAIETDIIPDATVVNLHPNFAYSADQRNAEGAFPHFEQMRSVIKQLVARDAGEFEKFNDVGTLLTGNGLRPRYMDEWTLLRKAWRLHRNGKSKFSKTVIEQASSKFHQGDPPDDLGEWIWRFIGMLSGPYYTDQFEAAWSLIEPLLETQKLDALMVHYSNSMVGDRGRRYFDMMRSFFVSWSELSQVHPMVSSGLQIEADVVAGSVDFDRVKMFYGNIFESFSSSVDLLAYINNVMAGRDFNIFQTMSLEQYVKTDKAGRANPFSANGALSDLCNEWDNQIRNASHHGSFAFDTESQVISYRSGKGGTGPLKELSFMSYLERSMKLFLQMMTLFRLELHLCQATGTDKPI